MKTGQISAHIPCPVFLTLQQPHSLTLANSLDPRHSAQSQQLGMCGPWAGVARGCHHAHVTLHFRLESTLVRIVLNQHMLVILPHSLPGLGALLASMFMYI